MPIDASIALQTKLPQFESPMNRMAQVLQLQGLEDSQEMNRLKADEYRRGVESQNKLRTLLESGADPEKLRRGGFLKEANDWEEKNAKVRKETAAADKDTVETHGKVIGLYRDAVNAINTPEAAMEFVKTMHTDPRLKDSAIARVPLDQALAQIPQDPAQLPAWQQKFALGAQKFMELNKPQFTTRNLGGTTDTLATEGLTGNTRTINSVKNTQSPDSVANVGVQYARLQEDKRHRGVTEAQGAKANELKEREMDGDKGAGGPILGVPVPAMLPWANQSNPKDANKVKAKEIERGAKEIEKDVDAARKEATAAAAAARFIELNKKVPTGGITDRVGLTRWAQSMGSDYAEMEALTARLAPAMREPGSGSTSDFDGKQFERATVGVDKPGKANENIAKAMIARAQQAQEYADFRQTYLEQNGTLQGADRFWKEYANKNPIFDPNGKDFALNPKRKPWSEHFKASDKPAASPAPSSGEGLTAAEKAELEALRKQLGRK